MTFALHPDFRLQKLRIGREQAPLVVIDNLVADPDELVDLAAAKLFGDVPSYYPGVRAKVPLTYQQFVIEQLRGVFAEIFRPTAPAPCVSRRAITRWSRRRRRNSRYLQRIPHVDSVFAQRTRVHSLPVQGGSRRHGFLPASQDRFRIHRLRRASPNTCAHIEEERHGPDYPAGRVHQRRHPALRADDRLRTASSIAC